MSEPSNWLSTEDNSPEHGVSVLLWSPPCWGFPDGEYEVRPFSTGRKGDGWSSISRHSRATHWMPLPKPPKGEAA